MGRVITRCWLRVCECRPEQHKSKHRELRPHFSSPVQFADCLQCFTGFLTARLERI